MYLRGSAVNHADSVRARSLIRSEGALIRSKFSWSSVESIVCGHLFPPFPAMGNGGNGGHSQFQTISRNPGHSWKQTHINCRQRLNLHIPCVCAGTVGDRAAAAKRVLAYVCPSPRQACSHRMSGWEALQYQQPASHRSLPPLSPFPPPCLAPVTHSLTPYLLEHLSRTSKSNI